MRRLLVALAVALGSSPVAAADMVASPSSAVGASLAPTPSPPTPSPPTADFRGETASGDARDLANWVAASRDNQGLPFLIVDKINAKVFMFDRHGGIRGATPALLGLGRGDDSVPGIGQRKLATISPRERTTPAGRFEAALGHDFEQDILWIDYGTALSLHRVIAGNSKDRRARRLASASVLDNRISFGCINVPASFYDEVVKPAFTATVGIVYIMPETRPLRAVFAIPETRPVLARSAPR
ncbi:MAG: L,D-transpeptidase [Sphingomonas bacterium]|nr:L,D-transpeptidase [Sphingomonas bacterium]